MTLIKTADSKASLVNISESNRAEMEKLLQQLQLKGYSHNTIRTYQNEFVQLLQALGSEAVYNLEAPQLQEYLLECMQKGLSEPSIHSRFNAMKFYFEQVLHKEKMFIDIPRPKKLLLLPRVLNKKEIAAIIKAIQNVKHKTMIMLGYGCGLRVSEITGLQIAHFDESRRLLMIKRGKGKKDRVVNLSPVLVVMLREYYRQYKPTKYLFEGQTPGMPYTIRSLEAIIKRAIEKAGIFKNGSLHMLRYSFVTHLSDKGTDVVMIQKLLGHNDIKTTLRYLHVTNRDLVNILSPLDDIKDLI